MPFSSPAPCITFPKSQSQMCRSAAHQSVESPFWFANLLKEYIWLRAVIYAIPGLTVCIVWLLYRSLVPLFVYFFINLACILGSEVPRSVGMRSWKNLKRIATFLACSLLMLPFLVSSEYLDSIQKVKLVPLRREGIVQYWNCSGSGFACKYNMLLINQPLGQYSDLIWLFSLFCPLVT